MNKKTEHVSINLNEIQTNYCQSCEKWLNFVLDSHQFSIDGVHIQLVDVPLLYCEKCDRYFFPDRTKIDLRCFLNEAKEKQKTKGVLSLKKSFDRRFNYCKVEFIYSHIDYEYIPGLYRPMDDGYLTPVFFNLAALNKYSRYPDYRLDLFSRTYGVIEKPNEFDICFGINRNKRVLMWLGDIDKLPESEQYYLRSENVESDHDVFSEFYESQIEIKFSEPSPENNLINQRAELNERCKSTKEEYLYKFSGEISSVISSLERPIFWIEKHVGPVIEAFNRIVVESLNSSFLKQELSSHFTKDALKGLKCLKLLEKWCEKVLNSKDASILISPFFVLNDFRVMTSHLISDDKKSKLLEYINIRLSLDPQNSDLEQIYEVLIDKLIQSYQQLENLLSSN